MKELLFYITVGLGTCDGAGDWCNGPMVGELTLSQELYKRPETHLVVDVSATHFSGVDGNEFSGINNGRLGGDYGGNLYLIRITKGFSWR